MQELLMSEAQIQKNFVSQFCEIRELSPLYKDILLVNSHTTGVRAGKDQLTRMINAKEERLMGSVKGMPDLEIFATGGRVFFIELKTPARYFTKGGKVAKNMGLEKEQIEIMNLFLENGFSYAICHSVDHIFQTLDNWGLA